jgi:hypothetical protein
VALDLQGHQGTIQRLVLRFRRSRHFQHELALVRCETICLTQVITFKPAKSVKPKKKQLSTENRGSKHPGSENLIPWKPGQSGNPGGRPKLLTDAQSVFLSRPCKITDTKLDENGEVITYERVGTRAEAIALRQATEAAAPYRIGSASAQLAAAETLRRNVEPSESETAAGTASALHATLMAVGLRVALEKKANAIEIDR